MHKMATNQQRFGALLLLLLSSFSLLRIEARPLRSYRGMDGLPFGMVKRSGPSEGGGGHRRRAARVLLVQHGIKDNSGPSPGVGHQNGNGIHP
ncbi:hypothetical protein RchiOBHm_Chr6g0255011 [Rosa chinensis]|uniref:Uncharacterized protein n=1 Tax=Rosa chinensis TaxID=74649 RepID=A0A2P6PLR5_ROSCH|nr:hypothetical protein RchiOBHm_Chr6g0255011 [Rosa chinensis]